MTERATNLEDINGGKLLQIVAIKFYLQIISPILPHIKNMSWEIVINKDADTDDTLKLIIATTNKYTKSKFVQEAAKKLCNSKDDLQNFRNVFEFDHLQH